ncbi:MAG: DUF1700 domain-containing protein [Defluviitaleaceae bacterium]|nr:DUF1700 domain-containing protein [Defluviitaleaceae bacterium]
MTKIEFLTQLENRLKVLPVNERQDALDYYEGYISDAENETAAIAQLGTPGEVAANILANYVSKTPSHGYSRTVRKEGAGGAKTAVMVILALFAIPIGLPLAIALAAVAFSLFIALLSVVFAVGVTGVALVVSGIIAIVTFPIFLVQDFSSALVVGGTGLIGLGLGIWFIRLTTTLTRWGFPRVARFTANKILRRNTHGR